MIEIGKASIAAVLATCGLFGWACNPAAADVRIEGLVHVGGGAVANSTVTLWAAGSGEPRQLAQAQTGNDGHFVLGSQVSTPQQKCIGWPEQKYISDAGKKAPELGPFRQTSDLGEIIRRCVRAGTA